MIVKDGILTSKEQLNFKSKMDIKKFCNHFYGWYFVSKIQSYFISDKKITKSAIGLEFQNLDNFTKRIIRKFTKII